MDVHDQKTRSYNMSRIRSKDTKPELIVRSFLHKNGVRFRLHDKKLPVKPDIILKKFSFEELPSKEIFYYGYDNPNSR